MTVRGFITVALLAALAGFVSTLLVYGVSFNSYTDTGQTITGTLV